MNPVTHFLLSWPLANAGKFQRRERALITLAGVSPDFDAFGIAADWLTRGSETPLHWWDRFHHILGHNLTFGLAVATAALLISGRRWSVAGLSLLAFHLHLVCDLIGARGPDGYQWPIAYLHPFTDSWQWVWKGQWALNAWPNILITGIAIALALFLSWKRGFSPIDLFSPKLDAVIVHTLRRRFGSPTHPSP